MINFSKVTLNDWRQFEHIDIDFNSQTTVLTGANGCGKTTILNVLSRHFGWNINFSATPFIGKKKKKKIFSDLRRIRDREESNHQAEIVGNIRYSNGGVCQLHVPANSATNPQYQLQYANQQPVIGLHIPSHRPAISFQNIDNLPVNPKSNQQQYQEFQQLLLQTYGSANVRNPGVVLKQSLISLALFGYGNEAVEENEEYKRLFLRFQEILRIVLPKSLGFEKLEIRMPDVVVITKTGDFPLSSMSGGVNSLFGIAWQIHMYGADKNGCTVILDEPENHLHPSMQRSLLPNLEKAFPNYKFIIATHSPFIVTSNPNANVYGLLYSGERKIISEHLGKADLSGSPDKILREILDVPTTLPIWVEEKISEILKKYEGQPDTEEKISKMFNELKESGLNDSLSMYDFKREG
ncbi:AAA family ATPase [Bowmanella yangjiangensis]|uniref:AAA family ATPase n=1 Tax=Bowmanella yangjiangensis TaxID=2811230 RepID=A0ABS3CVR3_9ALTE|nr:AAA family ATPase [Bowmanella yangjiangensis]MBN7821212.1 AAA family ATPase [Bowmanella yangjiangensis]